MRIRKVAGIAALLCSWGEAQTLQEVGRARALGGDVAQIWIAADQRHALTRGEHADFVWWNILEREVITRVPARLPYAQAVLHPRMPLAIIGWTDGGTGDPLAVHIVDLATGRTTPWFEREVHSMCFDATGDRLGVRHGRRAWIYELGPGAGPSIEPPAEVPLMPGRGLGVRFAEGDALQACAPEPWQRTTSVRSEDGNHEVVISNPFRREVTLNGRGLAIASDETWVHRAAVTNEGTVLAADLQGQLHFIGEDDRAPLVRTAHLGTAQRLEFSADGKFLAISTTGAVRIVDLAGRVVHEQEGSSIVCAGDISSEFWVFTRERCWRFHAGSRRIVGDVVDTATPTSVVCDAPSHAYLEASSLYRQQKLWMPSPVGSVGGGPWRAAKGGVVSHWNGRSFGTSSGRQGEVVGLLPLGNALALVTGFPRLDAGYDAHLSVLDADGRRRARQRLPLAPHWLATDADQLTIWIGGQGSVAGFRTDDLAPVRCDERNWITGVHWRAGLLLVSALGEGGNRLDHREPGSLQIVDPHRGTAEQTWALPQGMHNAYCLAVSPDRTLIALSQGADVWICRVR